MLGVPIKVNTGAPAGLPATWVAEVAFAPRTTEPGTYSIPVGKVTVTLAVVLAGGNFILIVSVPISKSVFFAKCTWSSATTLLTATCALAAHDKHKKATKSPVSVLFFSFCILKKFFFTVKYSLYGGKGIKYFCNEQIFYLMTWEE